MLRYLLIIKLNFAATEKILIKLPFVDLFNRIGWQTVYRPAGFVKAYWWKLYLADPFNLGRTATHEVGHWLNLKHTWGNAPCGDDLVADTPTQESLNSSCKPFPFASCTNYSDMFTNYMDYSFDACMNLFTQGQRNRMRATLNTIWVGLLSSPGGVSLNLTAADERIFQLFPNPSNGLLYLESFLAEALLQLKVTDTAGKKQLVKTIEKLTPQRIAIDLSGLANGIYILVLCK